MFHPSVFVCGFILGLCIAPVHNRNWKLVAILLGLAALNLLCFFFV